MLIALPLVSLQVLIEWPGLQHQAHTGPSLELHGLGETPGNFGLCLAQADRKSCQSLISSCLVQGFATTVGPVR